jgi:hypothetical protein
MIYIQINFNPKGGDEIKIATVPKHHAMNM